MPYRIAYFGDAGSETEDAILALFGNTALPVGKRSMEAVAQSLRDGETDGCLLQLDNVTSGAYSDAAPLLQAPDLRLEAEISLSVDLCLAALPGQVVEDIHYVLSQPQALVQCAAYLDGLTLKEQIAGLDTAGSARFIREANAVGFAAVATACAAALYHLAVLAERIQTVPENITSYGLLTKRSPFSRVKERTDHQNGVHADLAARDSRVGSQERDLLVVSAAAQSVHPGGDGLLVGPGRLAATLALAPVVEMQIPLPTSDATPGASGAGFDVSPCPAEAPDQRGALPARAPLAPAILITDLCKAFDKGRQRKLAVDHLTLQVERGEIFGLLGPNGAGKTTTISMLCGLLQPTAGTLAALGYDVRRPRELRALRKKLGVVSQGTALYGELSAVANLAFQAALYGLSPQETRRRTQEVLELVGLLAVKDRPVSSYSGGMQRRLAIARALLPDPDLLVLDEPTLGVDVQSKLAIWAHIKAMRAQGKTVLLTTNTLEEAQSLADRLAILDHGRLLVLDTLANLTARFGDGVLQIQTAFPTRQLDALRALPGVTSVEQTGAHLRLVARGMNDHLTAQVLTIVAQEGAVRQFQVQKPSLDEIFLELTGAALRD